MSTIKVVLSKTYGPDCTEEDFADIISGISFPKCRVGKIVDYLKTHGELEFRVNNTDIYRYEHNLYSIQEVDMSRPWTIASYDGLEYIQYLDYDVVDESMNYCELKE
jgi:hypothetical protein